jgi:hypothetical protein
MQRGGREPELPLPTCLMGAQRFPVRGRNDLWCLMWAQRFLQIDVGTSILGVQKRRNPQIHSSQIFFSFKNGPKTRVE